MAHLDPTQQLLASEGQGAPGVEEHLASCQRCRQEVQQLVRLNAAAAEKMGTGSIFSPHPAEEDPGPIPWADDPDMASREEPTTAAVERGALVGRYQVLEELGQGGMGVVYAAQDQELDRKVAVKLLKPGRGGDGHARLLREAQAMARVSHPNVLPVFDVGSFGRQVFVAMEFVAGGTLRDWLKKKPSWREVLGRFLAAGRGLAAAHAVGLVHRDFKPDNVLVGKDGRVFVTDFGLARLVSDTAPEHAAEPTEASRTGLSAQLTQAGVVMGTPAYMAPEQHLGRAADARSDQFSFAAALYWGLWRKRPFDPQRLAAAAALSSDEVSTVTRTSGLRRRPVNEVIQPPPAEPKVPGWLKEAVLKALSLRPEDRYPSMDALLSELEQRIAVNRRSTWAAAAAVTLLAATTGVIGYRQVEARAELCSGGPSLISRSWGSDARKAMEKAFLATQGSAPAVAFEKTAQALDEYASAWTTSHREACESTRIRKEQPEEVLALRMACLDQRLHELKSLAALFGAADAKLVDRALDAANSLSSVGHCANISALTGRAPLPLDEAQRAEIAALDEALAEVKALRGAGKFKESLARVEQLAPKSAAIQYKPLEAGVKLARAFALERTGDLSATNGYIEAFFTADAGRDDQLKAEAAIALLINLADHSRLEDARHWVNGARGSIERLGGSRELDAELWVAIGKLRAVEGRPAEAVEATRRALQLADAEFGPRSPKRVNYVRSFAGALVDARRYTEAIPLLTEVVETTERTRGEDHPNLISPLYSLAAALASQKDHSAAYRHVDRALEIVRARSGPQHLRVAFLLEARATFLQEEGRLEEALGKYRESLAIKETKLEKDHPDLSYAFDGIGQCLLELGKAREALPWLEQALAVRGPDPHGLGESRFALARALVVLKRELPRARGLAVQAKGDYEKAGDPEKSRQVADWLAAH